MSPAPVVRRFIVAGRVQRVGFRMWTQSEAARRGISGWAANLPDGRVEVLAHGEATQVEVLREVLHQGPRHARVTEVEEVPVEAAHHVALQDLTPGGGGPGGSFETR